MLSKDEEAIFESAAVQGLVESVPGQKCIGVFSMGGSSAQYSTILDGVVTNFGSLGPGFRNVEDRRLGIDSDQWNRLNKTTDKITISLNKSVVTNTLTNSITNIVNKDQIPVMGLKSGFILFKNSLKKTKGLRTFIGKHGT